MFRRRRLHTQDSGFSARSIVAVLAAIILALVPGVASAQALPAPERDEVMLWTTIVSVLALAACAVGFAYRRMRGMDHPTPDELTMMGHGHGDGHHDEGHAGAEQAPAHH